MIKTTTTTTDKDLGWKKFRDEMKKVKGAYVTVGVHSDAGEYRDGNATVAQVAMWNEFGTETIESRPFIRSTLADKQSDLNILRERWMDKIAKGEGTVDKALKSIGFLMRQWIMNKIESNMPPPNAPSVTAAKIKDGVTPRTLVNTGLLLRSIAFRVVSK